MNWGDVGKIVTATIASVGGGGIIVTFASSQLGKLWADRFMEKERAGHALELEKLRAELRRSSDEELQKIHSGLEIFKHKHLRGHDDKLQIYRLVVDVVTEILGDLDLLFTFGELPQVDRNERWDRFNRGRMRAYGYLVMLAPQTVMDACDNLFDYLIQVLNTQESYKWSEVRKHALTLLNAMRLDVGIDSAAIQYNGIL